VIEMTLPKWLTALMLWLAKLGRLFKPKRKPLRMLFIRHGETPVNFAHRQANNGDESWYTAEFEKMVNSQVRLTELGREQAEMTGQWLREHGLDTFGRYYHSSYLRAKETAALLGLPDAKWLEDQRLREKEHGIWGRMSRAKQKANFPDIVQQMGEDAFHTLPPGGESYAQLTDRLRPLISTLEEECSDDEVILVCHSDVMWAFVQVLEKMPIHDWLKLNSSKDAFHRIHNCQIIEYTRIDPVTGKVSPNLDWVRWVCPWDESLSRGTWRKISRPSYSNEELLEQVEKYPRLPEL
jgi:broad specificity phosphatase PhoE